MDTLSINFFVDLDLVVTQILTVVERKCHSLWSYEEKEGRYYHGIVYVLGGKAYYQMENESFQVEKGDMVFLQKGSRYFSKTDEHDPYHFIVVSFGVNNDSILQYFFSSCKIAPFNVLKCSSLFQELSRLWFYKGIAYKVKCAALLTEILYEIVRQSVQKEMHLNNYSEIQPAVSYMEMYYNKDISMEELAEMSRLSVSHFRKVFKEIFRVPPIKYLHYIRINKAKDMIMSGMYSMSEIADKTGYPSLYYFSRVFKKLTGLSPTAYGKMQ